MRRTSWRMIAQPAPPPEAATGRDVGAGCRDGYSDLAAARSRSLLQLGSDQPKSADQALRVDTACIRDFVS